jgi:hypothetical protein
MFLRFCMAELDGFEGDFEDIEGHGFSISLIHSF